MNRCKASKLVMHEAVPFGQAYTYHATDALAVMLHPEFFMCEFHRLRPGDQIMLVSKYSDAGVDQVREFAQCMILASDRHGVKLLPYIRHEIEVVKPKIEPVVEDLEVYSDGSWVAEWGGPKHKWRVKDGQGKVLVHGLDKERAISIANGHEELAA